MHWQKGVAAGPSKVSANGVMACEEIKPNPRRTFLQTDPNTRRQNKLWSRFGKLFSQGVTAVPALLPCAMLPIQPRGTHNKQFTEPNPQFNLSPSSS